MSDEKSLSDAELLLLEGLCAGATPGPWKIGGVRMENGALTINAERPMRLVIADVHNGASFGDMLVGAIRRGTGGFREEDAKTQRCNADLLAAARDSLPKLIAEIRQTRAALPQPGDPPSKVGFYWARWCISDDGTDRMYDCSSPNAIWEVVELYLNDDEEWRVWISGVPGSQAAENFAWGPGPLAAPPPPRRDIEGSEEKRRRAIRAYQSMTADEREEFLQAHRRPKP